MIVTVSSEHLLQYALNNYLFYGEPQVIIKRQLYTMLNVSDPPIPTLEQMQFFVEVADGAVFVMPTVAGYTYDYTVDWGDSVVENVTDENGSHLYAAAGTYSVLISGVCPSFVFDNTGTSKDMIVEVATLGNLVFLELGFYGCINLVSVESGLLADTSGATSLPHLLDGCTSLQNCILNLDFSAAKEFAYFFRRCTSLQYLDLSTVVFGNITRWNESFDGCNALETFIFDFSQLSNVTSFSAAFRNCSSLTGINTEGMVGSACTSISLAFGWCIALTSFSVENWDISRLNNVGNCFNGCNLITDPAPEWWDLPLITTFTNCFYNNTSRSNYDDIPDDWKGIGRTPKQ